MLPMRLKFATQKETNFVVITKKFQNILLIFSNKLFILSRYSFRVFKNLFLKQINLIQFYVGVQKYATLYFKLKNEMNSFRTTKTLNHCILLDI